MRRTKIIATVGPASRSPESCDRSCRRRRRLPSQLFPRHARVARRDLPRDSTGGRGRRTAYRRHAGPERTEDPDGSAGRERTAAADRGRRAADRGRRSALRAGPDLHAVSRSSSNRPAGRSPAARRRAHRAAGDWAATATSSSPSWSTAVLSAARRASTPPASRSRRRRSRRRTSRTCASASSSASTSWRSASCRPPTTCRARAEICRTAAGRRVPLIAKIERPAAVENLAAILEVAQGVMVARGDLGLEMPLERVPRVQKEIIRTGADARPAGDRRHAGARVDAHRAAADARRGQRCRQRRRRRDRRDHAGGGDGGWRVIRCARCRCSIA